MCVNIFFFMSPSENSSKYPLRAYIYIYSFVRRVSPSIVVRTRAVPALHPRTGRTGPRRSLRPSCRRNYELARVETINTRARLTPPAAVTIRSRFSVRAHAYYNIVLRTVPWPTFDDDNTGGGPVTSVSFHRSFLFFFSLRFNRLRDVMWITFSFPLFLFPFPLYRVRHTRRI